MRRGFGKLEASASFEMLTRVLALTAILCSELGYVKSQGYPCYSAERIPIRDRRFFAFVPSNVVSNPPIECVFLFGGSPGSRLRMSAYDVQTSEGGATGVRCAGAALRVYDVGRRGLQLMATYCGLLRRGQLLTMSSNMAVVTFTAYNNVMNNAFSLVVDSVEKDIGQRIPCPSPTAAAEPSARTQETPIPSTTPGLDFVSSAESDSSSSEGSGSADEEDAEDATNLSDAQNSTESDDYTFQENATQLLDPNEI